MFFTLKKISLLIMSAMMYAGLLQNAMAQPNTDVALQHPYCTVDLPNGEKMDFVFVKVSDDSNLFSSRSFTMGKGLNHGYAYNTTHATVGGSIYYKDPEGGNNHYWAIPMGKSEVTRGQYAAVMGLARPSRPNEPQTDVTKADILEFIKRLNILMYTPNSQKKTQAQILQERYAAVAAVDPERPSVTRHLHGNLYARLPWEEEWEFAARGGVNVEAPFFAKLYPYETKEDFVKNEVIAATSQSKASNVMSRGQGNPCGLYDMIGNVSELVETPYRPEYHFGRTGGLLLRGAYWANRIPDDVMETDESIIWASSYYRQEIPTIVKEGEGYKSSKMGFRLVLGSDFVVFGLNERFESDKELLQKRDMVKRHPDASPSESASVSMARVSTSVNESFSLMISAISQINEARDEQGNAGSSSVAQEGKLEDMDAQINQLTQQLAQRDAQILELLDQMKGVTQKIHSSDAIIQKSQETLAMAGLELLVSSTVFAAQDIYKVYHNEFILPETIQLTADLKEKIKKSIAALNVNINRDWLKVVQGCEALALADESIVDAQLKLREQAIIKNGDPYEIAYFKVSQNVYVRYKQSGSISLDERETWRTALREQCLKVQSQQGH